MLQKSVITGEVYDNYNIIHILNPQQALFYMIDCKVPLLDIQRSTNRYGKEIAVYCFDRKDTTDAFDKWVREKETKAHG